MPIVGLLPLIANGNIGTALTTTTTTKWLCELS